MSQLQVPEFEAYEEEAEFWDNLDTADFMEDDGEWFNFETPTKRAIRVAILPEIKRIRETIALCLEVQNNEDVPHEFIGVQRVWVEA